MKQLLLLLSIFIITSCNSKKTIKKQAQPKLTFLWETDTLLTTVESVIFDVKSNFIYASNIEGSPAKKDQKGSISKIDLNGKIIKRDWIKGLNAPKGIDILNGKMYVTDIDRLLEINIANAEITNTYNVTGAVFLNDVATSSDGKIYFSDTDTNKIFYLENNKIHTLMEFEAPNGLLVVNDKLLAVSWSKKTLNSIDLKTKKIEQLADSIPNPDGIEAIKNSNYFVSSWNGMIHHVASTGQTTLLLDTKKDDISAADIDYIASKKILLVPTFFKNKVMAYSYSE